jgi:hypothetical protein
VRERRRCRRHTRRRRRRRCCRRCARHLPRPRRRRRLRRRRRRRRRRRGAMSPQRRRWRRPTPLPSACVLRPAAAAAVTVLGRESRARVVRYQRRDAAEKRGAGRPLRRTSAAAPSPAWRPRAASRRLGGSSRHSPGTARRRPPAAGRRPLFPPPGSRTGSGAPSGAAGSGQHRWKCDGPPRARGAARRPGPPPPPPPAGGRARKARSTPGPPGPPGPPGQLARLASPNARATQRARDSSAAQQAKSFTKP